LRAPECTPDASQGEKTTEIEAGQGHTEARPAGSEHKEGQSLGDDKGGEEKSDEPRLTEIHELGQVDAARLVEIGCCNYHRGERRLAHG
jgi:hypothetical protein